MSVGGGEEAPLESNRQPPWPGSGKRALLSVMLLQLRAGERGVESQNLAGEGGELAVGERIGGRMGDAAAGLLRAGAALQGTSAQVGAAAGGDADKRESWT